MNRTMNRIALLSFVFLAVSACGAGDSESVGAEDDVEFELNTVFDKSQLPADFPLNLIPLVYDTGSYTQLGNVDGASFESRRPVEESISYYTGVLGEPTISVDAGDGDRTAQWHTSPWAIAVMGNEGESIVGISRVAE